MPSVTFGREYFRKIRNDYANPSWGWAREAAQNAVDAGATEITVTSSGPFVSCENNGPPMDEATLIGKLMAMGETTKDGGSTGGMGVAKAILFWTWPSYQVHTGDLLISGSGGHYDLSKTHFIDGTKYLVEFDSSEQAEKVVAQFKRWSMLCQWNGAITINGEVQAIRTKKGYHRKTSSFGKIYTNNSWNNRVIVRKNGQPMFVFTHDFKKCVIVELEGDSTAILTSNRDGLRYPFSDELQSFLNELAVDKRSALKNHAVATTIDIYRGPLVKVVKLDETIELMAASSSGDPSHAGEETPDGEKAASKEDKTTIAAVEKREQQEVSLAVAARAAARTACEHHGESVEVDVITNRSYEVNLFVKNSTGMKIPACYLPGQMSGYTQKLLGYYTKALKAGLEVLGKQCLFSIGLLFDNDDTEAAYGGEDPNFGHVFYIAPVAVQAKNGTRSMKKRYKLDAVGRWAIVANALHELVHIDHHYHDENFGNKLTDLMAMALAKRAKFSQDW